MDSAGWRGLGCAELSGHGCCATSESHLKNVGDLMYRLLWSPWAQRVVAQVPRSLLGEGVSAAPHRMRSAEGAAPMGSRASAQPRGPMHRYRPAPRGRERLCLCLAGDHLYSARAPG